MRLAHVSWKTAEEYFKNNDTVLIATGSIECHGVHTALGTDTLVPDKLIELIEDEVNVLIAPTVPYGACDSLREYPGTISLSDDGFYDLVKRIVMGFKKHGAKKFIFLNGHGGNVGMLKRICLELDDDHCLGTIINWWLLAGKLNPKWSGGHGGAQETSAVMAINEDFVNLSKVVDLSFKDISETLPQHGFYDVLFKGQEMMVPRKISHIAEDGWIGPDHPSRATVKWGQEMLTETALFIIDYIETFRMIEI